MRAHPMIFSGPMVKALLDGRKSQTRRLLKRQPERIADWSCPGCDGWRFPEMTIADGHPMKPGDFEHCGVPYAPGDFVWVREMFSGPYRLTNYPPRDWELEDRFNVVRLWYWADGDPSDGDWTRPKPPIHMPRWASRLTLEISDVRVQRLQEMSEDDADAEIFGGEFPHVVMPELFGPHEAGQLTIAECFGRFWDSLHKPGARWADDPWVAALSFRVHHANIDTLRSTS